jgi:hypothetical protein
VGAGIASKGRPFAAHTRGLLKRVGELQDAEVVVQPTDDLNADGQARPSRIWKPFAPFWIA